jgi:carbon storage regulator
MLCLSRKKKQSIVINGNIVVTITEIRGGNVKIGIEAPEGVKVLRKELIQDGKNE